MGGLAAEEASFLVVHFGDVDGGVEPPRHEILLGDGRGFGRMEGWGVVGEEGGGGAEKKDQGGKKCFHAGCCF